MRCCLFVALICGVCLCSAFGAEKEKEYPISIKVLNTNSTPYVTHSGGNTHTDCRFGDTSADCDTYNSDTTWRHVQNTMMVEASDGKLYTISCTASVRWSKCAWLKVGDTFPARWEKHGLAVQYHDAKGKPHEQTYIILGSAEVPPKPAEPAPTRIAVVTETGVCNVVSNPSGADISVDGVFAGNTPSTLSLKSGKHTIAVSAKGFRQWSRDLSIEGGSNISLNATLDREESKE